MALHHTAAGPVIGEVRCDCGASVPVRCRHNGLAHIRAYADPQTGEPIDARPGCGESVVTFDAQPLHDRR